MTHIEVHRRTKNFRIRHCEKCGSPVELEPDEVNKVHAILGCDNCLPATITEDLDPDLVLT